MSSIYLDIETTSLEPDEGELTVLGLYDDEEGLFVQLFGEELRPANLLRHFARRPTLYTFNGGRFDLPYIRAKLGVDLMRLSTHVDLMHACHARNLYGGMKKVERLLGIPRKLTEVNGLVAIELWRRYRDGGCRRSLDTLLEYNREDVMNLRALRNALGA
jgi:uncharacterized protein YprB with RNaseH-like and TPR domain